MPNILTLIRLLLIPLFLLVFFSNAEHSLILSIVIFIISGITDILDGYLARKHNLITKLGTVLDPLADKLMLLTVLISLTIKKVIPNCVPIIILIKESIMIMGGILLYKKNTVIPSNIFGKLSTFFFYIAIVTLCFHRIMGIYMLYCCVISSIIAFISYVQNYIKFKKQKK
ncbi:CDP-diacylglycerol--glycerol-3-phosphate 3-phosphatidyltransferase [Hathewaya proteolytica]|nr:CDP-diacylglycerol--glycerol-3-phosphate 3-phosphatidyltransferase [Hathewaya proteolytica]